MINPIPIFHDKSRVLGLLKIIKTVCKYLGIKISEDCHIVLDVEDIKRLSLKQQRASLASEGIGREKKPSTRADNMAFEFNVSS